jgi:hypothetical protein
MPLKHPTYGLVAEFDAVSGLMNAVRSARQEGYTRIDAYTPFPVEGLPDALGHPRTRLPWVIFLGGLIGGVGGYFMQYYASAISYPVNIGGRPLNSWPAFIPITFELTVLIGSLTAVLAMLGRNGLPMPYHPLFNVERFAQASRDRFFLCIEARDPKYDPAATRRFLEGLGARAVTDVPA